MASFKSSSRILQRYCVSPHKRRGGICTMRGDPTQHQQQYSHPILRAGRPNYCLTFELLDGSPFCIVPDLVQRLCSTRLAGSSMSGLAR